MMNNSDEKKLVCPKCGNSDLQFVSVQKTKDEHEPLIFISLWSFIFVAISAFFSINALTNFFAPHKEIVTTDIILGSTETILWIISFFGFFLIGLLCYGIKKIIPYKNELNYICPHCGQHDSFKNLTAEEENIKTPTTESTEN